MRIRNRRDVCVQVEQDQSAESARARLPSLHRAIATRGRAPIGDVFLLVGSFCLAVVERHTHTHTHARTHARQTGFENLLPVKTISDNGAPFSIRVSQSIQTIGKRARCLMHAQHVSRITTRNPRHHKQPLLLNPARPVLTRHDIIGRLCFHFLSGTRVDPS